MTTEPARRVRRRGRPTAAEREAQSSLEDMRVEDAELEDFLRLAYDTAEAAQENRGANKGIKSLLSTNRKAPGRLRHLTNVIDDGVHSGYVICGDYRFKPRSNPREAGTVEINVSEGETWAPLEIEKIG